MKFKDNSRFGVLGPIAAALIFLVTINLRPAITAVGPVIHDIENTFGLTPSTMGLLGSLPLIMFALIGPLGSWLTANVGVNRVLLGALLAIAAGVLIRSYLGLPGLWIGAIIATGAIAIGNVLVPVVVRRDYPSSISLATAIYSATMGLGASLASAFAVPIADESGWQLSLAIWALPAFVVAILWFPRIIGSTAERAISKPRVSVWRLRKAWLLGLFMGLQSSTFYFMVTWLPTIEIAAGKPADEAGMTLFWYQIVGMVSGLFIPFVMKGKTNQIVAALTASIPLLLAYIGFIVMPELGLVWALIMGFGSGTALVVTLSLIGIRSSGAHETATLSGMVQSFGYLLAALMPVAAGVIVELTGSWNAALIMMATIAGLQIFMSFVIGKDK